MSLKLYKAFRVCFSIGLCHYSADLKGQFTLKSQTHISIHGLGGGAHKKTDCIQGPGYMLCPWNSTTGKWENMLILWIAQPLDVLLLKWIIMTVVTLLLFIQHYYRAVKYLTSSRVVINPAGSSCHVVHICGFWVKCPNNNRMNLRKIACRHSFPPWDEL